MGLRRFLCQTASVAAFAGTLIGGSAAAQDATETVSSDPTREALQDTPIAITAVTGEDLHKKGAVDISSVADSAPNMLLTSGGTFAGTAGTPGRPREWSFSIGRQY